MNSALDDWEESLRSRPSIVNSIQRLELGQAARRPANASLARVAGRWFIRLTGNNVVELHDHVGADVSLDPHDLFRREEPPRSIDVALELDAFFADSSERCKGEDLEAAGVGEDRTVPAHELVQAAHLANELV